MTRYRSTKSLLAAALLATAAFSSHAVAQDAYPSRTVEAIHQFGPGGGTDNFVRAVSEPFQTITGQSLVSISVQGGGGIPSVTTFMQRRADGHTVLAVGPEEIINHVLGRFDATQLQPVARIQYDQGLFLVSANSPLQTVQDLIDAATAAPGSLNIAVTGAAGFDDTLVGLWNLRSGAELSTVPFSASEMVSNTLGGHVDLMFEEYGAVRGLIESGDLRPLVLFSEERLPVLPDVPTATELGYEVELGRWRGFTLKEGDSPEHVAALADIMSEAAQSEPYKANEEAGALQYRSVFLGPEEFQAFLEAEIEVYTEVLTELGYVE
jgi:putative tricarboxylic transport membrane protein